VKTPLTITASAWNYCQNSCQACVSRSNRPEWTYHGNFEIFSPGGCAELPDISVRALYGQDYYQRLCPDKKRFLNKKDVLDFDFLIRWILRHVPGCELHVSGGECLLRPDIEDQIEKLVKAGINTTIFTNGLLISKRPRLHDMPLKWVVAHHIPNPLDKWLENVEMIAHRPLMTTRLVRCQEELENMVEIAKNYTGLNFYWGRGNSCKRGVDIPPNPHDLHCVASEVLHLIVPDGRVFPCNVHSTRCIGHTITGEYLPELAKKQDRHSRQCITAKRCSAYQTAQMVHKL
jgi:hypothetical protein